VPAGWNGISLPSKARFRAATFTADRTLTPPQCVIGERFVQGCQLCQLNVDGTLKTTEGPKFRRTAMELKLVDVNGDGRSDLVTAGGEIFLRGADGKLPDTASLTLDRPYGDWTYLAVGDFNGDGKPHVAQVGMQGLHVMTSVFYNTGDPRQPYHSVPDSEIDLGPELEPIRDGPTVADFTGDGIDDLILGHAQRQNIVIIPGSKTGLDRAHSLHQKVDYRLHYDTKIGVLDLDGKRAKSIADFGTSAVGASGVYIRMPDVDRQEPSKQ
jgi:hypothetical protein